MSGIPRLENVVWKMDFSLPQLKPDGLIVCSGSPAKANGSFPWKALERSYLLKGESLSRN